MKNIQYVLNYMHIADLIFSHYNMQMEVSFLISHTQYYILHKVYYTWKTIIYFQLDRYYYLIYLWGMNAPSSTPINVLVQDGAGYIEK